MYALIGMVTVVLVVNIFASVRVLTSGVITRRQKTLQLLFVWLIPVVGALVVAGVHRADSQPSKTATTEVGSGLSDNDVIDIALAARHNETDR